VAQEIEEAVAFTESSPDPLPGDHLNYIYAG
jgi:TPP-dependent pyruvate/acetoin dehydrogenase alpha subunit